MTEQCARERTAGKPSGQGAFGGQHEPYILLFLSIERGQAHLAREHGIGRRENRPEQQGLSEGQVQKDIRRARDQQDRHGQGDGCEVNRRAPQPPLKRCLQA